MCCDHASLDLLYMDSLVYVFDLNSLCVKANLTTGYGVKYDQIYILIKV